MGGRGSSTRRPPGALSQQKPRGLRPAGAQPSWGSSLCNNGQGFVIERQPAGAVERCQVDVGDAADWIIVQDQMTLDVHGPGTLVEVRRAEVGGVAVQRES